MSLEGLQVCFIVQVVILVDAPKRVPVQARFFVSLFPKLVE